MSDSATPWTAAWQASLSITNSWGLHKLMSVESVMPSDHLILCHPLLLSSIFPNIRVFSNESAHWCFWTVVLEKTLESPLDCKEITPVIPKENQSWIFIGRTVAEAKAKIVWLLDEKSWLIRKDPDVGKDWRQEKWMAEDKMAGCHHWLNGHEFEEALGDDEGQGSLACCSPWRPKDLDMTEQLNNNTNKSLNSVYKCYVYSDCSTD